MMDGLEGLSAVVTSRLVSDPEKARTVRGCSLSSETEPLIYHCLGNLYLSTSTDIKLGRSTKNPLQQFL